MPTLEELYKKHMQSMSQGATAFGGAVSSPLQTTGGALKGLGKVALGIGGTLLDIPQALLPAGVAMPGAASGPIVPEGTYDPKWSAPGQGNPSALPEWKQRLGLIANAATLGFGRGVADTYKQTGSIDDTAIETLKNFLPLHEMARLYTGESATNPGQIMTPEEYGENITHGLLKAYPLVKGIQGVRGALTKGVERFPPERHVLSSTEIAAGKSNVFEAASPENSLIARQAKIDAAAAEHQLASEIRKNLPKDALPEVKLDAINRFHNASKGLLTELGLDTDFMRQSYGKLSQNPEAAQAMVDNLLAVGRGEARLKPASQMLIETMKTDAGRQSVMEVMEKYGFVPEDAPALFVDVMDAFMTKTSNSGKILKSISDTQKQFNSMVDKLHGEGKISADKYTAFKSLQKALDLKNEPLTLFQKATNAYRNIEQIWRGAAVSSPVTANRNMAVGMGIFGAELFDSLMFGVEKYGASKILKAQGKLGDEAALTLNEAFAPAITKLTSMQELLMGGEKTVGGWLDYMTRTAEADRALGPIAKTLDIIGSEYSDQLRGMLGGPINDLHTINLMADGLRGAPGRIKAQWKNVETPMDAARFTVSALNTLSTTYELFWRKYFFVSRMREQLAEFGYKTPEEFIAAIKADNGLGPKYFGKVYDAQSLDQFINTGLKSKLETAYQHRLKNYKAQTGEKLHSAELGRAKTTHTELVEKANADLLEAKAKLEAGESWNSIADKLDPKVAQLIEGEIRHPSEIITNSVDHAMRSTLAATPARGTMGYSIMEMYNKFPFLYTLGSPFPRFAINSLDWIFKHNALDAIRVPMDSPFTGKFKETLHNIGRNPKLVTHRETLRQFERAHTGMALWAAAHVLAGRQDLAGPKYYHIKAGEDEKGNPIYADLRPYQPFVQYRFLYEVGRAGANNQVPNLTAAELTEAVTGLRRLSEVPIFAAADIIRQADTTNPGAFMTSIKTLAGQSFAAFFTPFRTMGDLAGAAGIESAVTQKDVSGNELLGPSVNQFPLLREALPDRVDPFTGKTGSQQFPAIRLAGPALRSMTKLDEEVSKSGIPLNDLLGNYADPEADRLVRKYIGQILGRTTQDGDTISNRLGSVLAQLNTNKPNEFRSDMVRRVFTDIRQQAVQAAMAENPYAFIEYAVRQRPESERPILRDMLKKHKAEAVRRQIQGSK